MFVLSNVFLTEASLRPKALGIVSALAVALAACGSEPSTTAFPSGDVAVVVDVESPADVVVVADVPLDTSSDEVWSDTSLTDLSVEPDDVAEDVVPDIVVAVDVAEDISGDASTGAPSLADFVRENGTVISSSRVVAETEGATLCNDPAGPTCLVAPCDAAIGCLYLAVIRYTSTPAAGTTAPPLRVHALYGQFAPRDEQPGHAPILILNHGGTTLDKATMDVGALAAQMGYAVMMPSYRGANGSDGAVEGCLGEVDDVRILADLIHDKAPDDSIFMMGGSHGGCVTLGALQAGAPVKAAVALWPGTDGARRFRYNRGFVVDGGPLAAARDACNGLNSACCSRVRQEFGFVSNVLIADAVNALGDLPDWATVNYACDARGFEADPSPWEGRWAQKEAYCARSPLARVEALTTASTASLLIIHGERDPYIPPVESCEYAYQAGGFSVRHIDDDGLYSPRGATTACRATRVTDGELDPTWSGDRHLLLVSPLGHGDTGRTDVANACNSAPVASPDINSLMFGFLAAKQ